MLSLEQAHCHFDPILLFKVSHSQTQHQWVGDSTMFLLAGGTVKSHGKGHTCIILYMRIISKSTITIVTNMYTNFILFNYSRLPKYVCLYKEILLSYILWANLHSQSLKNLLSYFWSLSVMHIILLTSL